MIHAEKKIEIRRKKLGYSAPVRQEQGRLVVCLPSMVWKCSDFMSVNGIETCRINDEKVVNGIDLMMEKLVLQVNKKKVCE